MNEVEIRKALDILKSKDEIVEVRVIGDYTYSGYFKNVDNLIQAIKPYQNDNIYFTLNEINEDCYGRSQCEKIVRSNKQTKTTSDTDIKARRYILIDIDPKRATGVSASDEEVAKARIVGNKVYAFLRDQGFTKPVCAFSGNGIHLLYKVNLLNNEENRTLLERFLHTLDMLFSDEFADVDTTVFNAARITKLYGTFSRKGANTEDRPHRISRILSVPDNFEALDRAYIQKVVDLYPKEEVKTWQNNYQGNNAFNLDEFISKHGINIIRKQPFKNGEKLIIDCPFDSNHKGDGAIFRLNNGAIGFKCFHNSCSHHNWESFRNHFEPNRFRNNQISYNRRIDSKTTHEYKPQIETDDKGKKFLTFTEIKDKDESKIVSIPTGFIGLDEKIIGLNKGELTLVSGSNASGKSSMIKQLCLNAADKGFKIIEYSGELDPTRSKSWTVQQAAGRQFVEATKYANYFRVPQNISDKISAWLSDKWKVYNNLYGSNFEQLVADVEETLSSESCDIFIVDNIMALDLTDISNDKYERQKLAVLRLKELALKYNIHIILVAHPRKSVSFLRKDDVSGSADLTNAVENVLLVHRKNNDFVRRAGEFFGEEVASQYYKYGNIIEVAKNRDLGICDVLVGLYYEIESKRFLNDFTDNYCYGWQDSITEEEPQFGFPQFDYVMTEQEFFSEPTPSDEIPF